MQAAMSSLRTSERVGGALPTAGLFAINRWHLLANGQDLGIDMGLGEQEGKGQSLLPSPSVARHSDGSPARRARTACARFCSRGTVISQSMQASVTLCP